MPAFFNPQRKSYYTYHYETYHAEYHGFIGNSEIIFYIRKKKPGLSPHLFIYGLGLLKEVGLIFFLGFYAHIIYKLYHKLKYSLYIFPPFLQPLYRSCTRKRQWTPW